LIERGRRAAGQQGDTFTVARALLNGLACLQEGGDPDEAWKAYREARRFVQERDLASIAGNIARCGADLAVRAGDLQQARRILDTQLGDELDPVEAAAIAAKAGVLALEAKDDTHAVALLDAHRADLDRIEQHWVRTYLAHLRVAVASRTGHPAEAEEALERYAEATGLAGHARRPDRAADAARYALHGGASVQAVSAFLRAVLIEADDAPSWWRTQLEVAVAAATGDHERVVDAGVPSRGPWPHLDADAYLAVARSLEVLGDTALATRHAHKARDLLDRWPGWRRDDTDALIQQLEHLDGPAITERQHEVLALVAEGLTNQQIGLRLAISPRTVAVHVSNLLRRTERASRTDLAAWALREGVLR
jgi:DNA-binding CsgD family transcriptional regulator